MSRLRQALGPEARRAKAVALSGALLAVLGFAAAAASVPEVPADPAPFVQRFLSRPETPVERYQARRLMHARNPRFRKEAWLEATTRFDSQEGFSYQVLATGGSSLVIARVLMPALRGEAEMWKRRDPEQYGLTDQNYAFSEIPPADGGTGDEVRVVMKPRRQHVLLVDGALVLAARDADLLRVEGRLSKSPSFWVSRVDVVRRYARIKGIRVPVELESVAQVRIAGRSELQVVYLYESINGEPITSADVLPDTRAP